MTERVVIISAPNIVANKITYANQVVNKATPELITNVVVSGVTTEVTTDIVKSIVTGLGEESLPNPTLFKRSQEYVSALDAPTITTSKTFADSLTTLDSFNVLIQYNRIFEETQPTSETIDKFVGKGLVNLSDVSDQNLNSVYKVLLDNVENLDTKTIRINKILVDPVQKLDQARIRIGKLVTETKTVSDIFSRTVNYNRTLLDFIDATDDFLGEANIDDDQVARVGKAVIDYANTQDNVRSIRVNKSLQDTETTTDIFARTVNYNRQFVDIAQESDLSFYRVGKNIQDTETATDVFSRVVNYNPQLTDLAQRLDTSFYEINKTVQDTAQESDLSFYQVGKNLQDTETTADIFARTVNYNRTLLDFIGATDDFLGEANIDDDQVARVGKAVIDYANTQDIASKFSNTYLQDSYISTDTIYKIPSKNISEILITSDVITFLQYTNYTNTVLDTIVSNDSGFINNQNYFADTYVLPGYVGTNTNFS
jgi:hypothetical protein